MRLMDPISIQTVQHEHFFVMDIHHAQKPVIIDNINRNQYSMIFEDGCVTTRMFPHLDHINKIFEAK